ncbi:hypothetical protein ISO55_00025 [Morganella morganii subsp. morganii]|uniref:hypothetical protein n=1 Tax=Morganella morganii TaxID=582 RepID=UPI001BD994BC|nr:hypothetical protein [Morganella morganii]MBT0365362.1 hypothetical protein [Morganella morganii subsp. morganii]
MKKCESNEKKYASYLCDFMRKRAKNKSPTGKSKGIYKYTAVDTMTGDSLGEAVYYDEGNGSRIHINFCPFCGGKLHSVDIGE